MSPKTDPRKGEDLVHSIQVSLEDIYKGKTTELCLTKHIICGECNGDSARKCYTCKGCGERVVMRRRRLTLQKVPQHCDDCDGTGKVIDPEYRCEKCLGKKVMSEKKVLEVHIDKGVETGKKITFSGESDQAPDTIPGDVVIVLDEKPHERFRREGNDLWHETEIDLLTALGGGSFPIMHLDDRALIVNLVPGGVTKHGALKVIQGQGMPAYGQPERGTGDLYIRIFVAFPVYIVPSVIPFLEGALPPHRDLPEFDEKIELEEVELSVDLATIGQRKAADKGRGDRSHLHKGGDPDQSEETTHANDGLPDEQKRSLYDQSGEAGLKGDGMGGGKGPRRQSSQDEAGSIDDGGPYSRQTGLRRGKDLVHHLRVSLEDLYKGKTTKLALTRKIICGKCNGKGGKKGLAKECTTCGGRGVLVILSRIGTRVQQIQQPCSDCDGTGEAINPKGRCKQCSGEKVVSDKKFLEAHLDKGMKGGQKITFPGESDQAPDTIPGDVVIVLDEKPHERFRREGDDLWHETEIDLLTALGGGSFAILHLDDRALIVNLEPGKVIEHGALEVIQGQGMPVYGQPKRGAGDLYVRINVVFPPHIEPLVIPLLERALPPRRALPRFDMTIRLEEVELSELDARQLNKRRPKSEEGTTCVMDEDEDDTEPRVQCANQ